MLTDKDIEKCKLHSRTINSLDTIEYGIQKYTHERDCAITFLKLLEDRKAEINNRVEWIEWMRIEVYQAVGHQNRLMYRAVIMTKPLVKDGYQKETQVKAVEFTFVPGAMRAEIPNVFAYAMRNMLPIEICIGVTFPPDMDMKTKIEDWNTVLREEGIPHPNDPIPAKVNKEKLHDN